MSPSAYPPAAQRASPDARCDPGARCPAAAVHPYHLVRYPVRFHASAFMRPAVRSGTRLGHGMGVSKGAAPLGLRGHNEVMPSRLKCCRRLCGFGAATGIRSAAATSRLTSQPPACVLPSPARWATLPCCGRSLGRQGWCWVVVRWSLVMRLPPYLGVRLGVRGRSRCPPLDH